MGRLCYVPLDLCGQALFRRVEKLFWGRLCYIPLDLCGQAQLYTPGPLWAGSVIYPWTAPAGEKGNVGSSMEAAPVSAAQPD